MALVISPLDLHVFVYIFLCRSGWPVSIMLPAVPQMEKTQKYLKIVVQTSTWVNCAKVISSQVAQHKEFNFSANEYRFHAALPIRISPRWDQQKVHLILRIRKKLLFFFLICQNCCWSLFSCCANKCIDYPGFSLNVIHGSLRFSLVLLVH